VTLNGGKQLNMLNNKSFFLCTLYCFKVKIHVHCGLLGTSFLFLFDDKYKIGIAIALLQIFSLDVLFQLQVKKSCKKKHVKKQTMSTHLAHQELTLHDSH